MDAALADVQPEALLDHHVHAIGLGTGGSGAWVHPKMLSWADPVSRIKMIAYLSGADVSDLERADEQYVARLVDLGRHSPGGRLLLLAFDHRYDAEGNRDLEHSEFHTPNGYVYALAQRYPDLFLPAVSVHPHRGD